MLNFLIKCIYKIPFMLGNSLLWGGGGAGGVVLTKIRYYDMKHNFRQIEKMT